VPSFTNSKDMIGGI